MVINPAAPPRAIQGAPYGMESCLMKTPNGTYFSFWDTSAWANVAGNARTPWVVRPFHIALPACYCKASTARVIAVRGTLLCSGFQLPGN
jgi:hypothetical protein